MNSLEYIISNDIITEDANFLKSYNTAMHLFNKFDPKTNKNPHMELVGEDHAVTRLSSKGTPTCVFYHKIHQPEYIIQGVNNDSHYVMVYHHNDMDGYVSAASVANVIPLPDDRFMEYNFGDPNPIMDATIEALSKKAPNQKTMAIIVDLSLPWDENKSGLLSFILATFDEVIWIDHHGTSLNVANRLVEKKPSNLSMFIDTRMSAAMQCKCVFKIIADTMVHQIVSYYDRKDDRRNPGLYQLGVYLNQYIHDFNANTPGSTFYQRLIVSEKMLSQVLATGESLCAIKSLKDSIMYHADTRYQCTRHGLTIIGLNGSGNSMRFTDPTTLHTIKVLFRKLPDGNWLFSAYTDSPRIKKMNLGAVLREEFGGGGHPGAAGANFPYQTLADQSFGKCTDLENYVYMEGSEPRSSKKLKELFTLFCKVLMYHWDQMPSEESDSSN